MEESKHRKGRPLKGETPKSHYISCRFNEEEYDKLLKVAQSRGISRTDFIVNAINEAWNEVNKKK